MFLLRPLDVAVSSLNFPTLSALNLKVPSLKSHFILNLSGFCNELILPLTLCKCIAWCAYIFHTVVHLMLAVFLTVPRGCVQIDTCNYISTIFPFTHDTFFQNNKVYLFLASRIKTTQKEKSKRKIVWDVVILSVQRGLFHI